MGFWGSETYYGVSKDELDEIAALCRYGSYVTINGNKLCYHYKSGRGHQMNYQEFIVSDGELRPLQPWGGYPGQVFFPEKKFMSICNARYVFE